MVRFSLTMIGLILFFTVFLFPHSEPGKVINLDTGAIIAKTSIVTLSPVFCYGRSDELYSFVISPHLRSFQSSGTVALVRPNVNILNNGMVLCDWSFSWIYWLLVNFVPSVIIAGILSWKLKRPTQANLEKVMELP